MGGRIRELSNKNVTPGPGSYSSFSEFGYIDSKYAQRYRESQEKTKKNSCERFHRKSMSNGFIKHKKESFNKDYASFDKDNIDRDLTKYFNNDEDVK